MSLKRLRKNQEVHIKKMEKFDDYRKLTFPSLLMIWKQEVQN